MDTETYRPDQTSAGPSDSHVVGELISWPPMYRMLNFTPTLETRYAGFIGIDPGATGAIALLDENGNFMTVFDYQGSPPTMWSLLQDLKNVRIKLAVLEQVHSMPKQGVATTFKFGTNYGIWQMACAAMGWPMELITPQRWRKILDSSVPLKPTKEDLRQYALRRWPEANNFLQRKGDHGRAEAMIMAMYARMRVLGEAK